MAQWDRRRADTQESVMSSIYVLIYDSKAVLRKKEFCQEDGFSRTMYFVRSDDFMNW